MSNIQICDQCGRCRGGQYFTAECMTHSLCSTCTAIFLDGNSSMPNCSKCEAKIIMEYIMKNRPRNIDKGRNLKMKMMMSSQRIIKVYTFNEGKFNKKYTEIKSTADDVTTTSTSEDKLDVLESIERTTQAYKFPIESTQTFPVVTGTGNVYLKLDPISGKTIRFFPYIPKTFSAKVNKISQQFHDIKLEGTTSNKDVQKLQELKIPTNHKMGSSSDLAYVDNLFAFLREEKSKHQHMKIPSITSKNYKGENEFSVIAQASYKQHSYQYEPNCSDSGRPQSKPPVVTNLLNQIETYENQNTEECKPDHLDEEKTDRQKKAEPCVFDTLTLRPSISPASDVKGEYGSEDDKQSISSNSGSGSLEQHSYNSGHSRSSRSDGVKCPLPVYEKAFDASDDHVAIEDDNDEEDLPRELWDNGYNADIEEERGTSPNKVDRANKHYSSGWLLDTTLPEPNTVKQESSEEEDGEQGNTYMEDQLCGAESSTTADILYLDDDIEEDFWGK